MIFNSDMSPKLTRMNGTHGNEPISRRKLYEMLGVNNEASEPEIRKAFRMRALLTHPDKRPDDPQAAKNFAALKQAHDILIDPQRRRHYDDTGDENEETETFRSAYEYFRLVFPKLAPQDIEVFSKTYKGSAAEDEDLINYFDRFGGDLKHLIEWIPLSEHEDLERLLASFDRLISNHKLKSSILYERSKESLRSRTSRMMARKKKSGGNNERVSDIETLAAILSERQRKRSAGLLAVIEDKYAKKAK